MKWIIILVLCCLMQYNGKAQLVEEWIRQKETQKKYLLQQIIALHVYLGHVEKGYRISKEGMNAISNIKSGDFDLHASYFTSLQRVSPKVKTYAKVAQIILLQKDIVREYKSMVKTIKGSDLLSSAEVDYINRILASLLYQCEATIEALTAILSPGIYGLNDSERIQRIDDLYETIRDQHRFIQSFGAELKLLVLQKKKEKVDTQRSNWIQGVKK